jgi:hypothetical protein
VVGGDFNMVEERGEKSTGNVNSLLMQLFNDFVVLRELHRHGGSYTWSNK